MISLISQIHWWFAENILPDMSVDYRGLFFQCYKLDKTQNVVWEEEMIEHVDLLYTKV